MGTNSGQAGRRRHPFLEAVEQRVVLGDGAMGTLLYSRGAPVDVPFDSLNLTHRQMVEQVHLDYLFAGAEMLTTNTFSANRVKLAPHRLDDRVWQINLWGAKIARAAREIAGQPAWVAGSVGPLGKPLAPLGPLSEQEAREAFREQMEGLLAGGVDLFIIETMSDVRELALAVEVARSLGQLPVVAEMTFSTEGETAFGTRIETVLETLAAWEGPYPDLLGVNCGAGPAPVFEMLQVMAGAVRSAGPPQWLSQVRLSAFPNAGLPHRIGSRYMYGVGPAYFASFVRPLVAVTGVRLLGGCCGTTPEHIAAMRGALDALQASAESTDLTGPARDRETTPGRERPLGQERASGRETPPDREEARPAAGTWRIRAGAQGGPGNAGGQGGVGLLGGQAGPAGPSVEWQGSGRLEEGAGLAARRPAAARTPRPANRLPAALAARSLISVELDPPRGSQTGKFLRGAALLLESGVDTVNIADSPMARVRMSALAAAQLVQQETGLVPLVHFTTRDRNLMGIQSDLLGAHALGLTNILALTGDPPAVGNYAHATGVFDVDSIGLIQILRGLNEGRDMAGNAIGKPTAFTIACALSPNAPDLQLEIDRFRRKVGAGAHFAMTQPLYELEPLERLLERLGGSSPIPLVLGVMPLHSLKHAEYLHNEVPGITVPLAVRRRLEEAGEGGERMGLELALQLIERARPLIAGVYIVPSFGKYEGVAELVRELRREGGVFAA